MANELVNYRELLTEIKGRIAQAQTRAALAANAELIALYWDIGRMIAQRQQAAGWGASVIPRLSRDLRSDLPEIKGFSERNMGRMVAFYREYASAGPVLPQPEAKLQSKTNKALTSSQNLSQSGAKSPSGMLAEIIELCPQIPWMHNILLMRRYYSQSR